MTLGLVGVDMVCFDLMIVLVVVVVGSGWIVEDMPHIQNAGSDGSAQVLLDSRECA